ncbi:hypothetical protein J4410_02770, partial [Candidatus Woesearchaeota archaeon]|nr:hypothetical protein [Candidatus Woesearchaeota archaeon]
SPEEPSPPPEELIEEPRTTSFVSKLIFTLILLAIALTGIYFFTRTSYKKQPPKEAFRSDATALERHGFRIKK